MNIDQCQKIQYYGFKYRCHADLPMKEKTKENYLAGVKIAHSEELLLIQFGS